MASWALDIPDPSHPPMEYVARIRSRFPEHVLAVMSFGSKARGAADAEADIDLMILVEEESGVNASPLRSGPRLAYGEKVT